MSDNALRVLNYEPRPPRRPSEYNIRFVMGLMLAVAGVIVVGLPYAAPVGFVAGLLLPVGVSVKVAKFLIGDTGRRRKAK